MSENLTPAEAKPLKCVVLTPIGPGHEALAREAQASVEAAFRRNPGPFAEVFCLSLDDTRGKHGRSRRRNDGIAWALANGYEWIFFLDADDLMAPDAFAEALPHMDDSDAIFGLIVEQTGNGTPQARPGQLGATSRLVDIVRNDPYLTLQMGHFVRSRTASVIGFDVDMDTGEDFKYYLELWRQFRCRKIDRPLFINRRGRHSAGPRSADGRKWRDAVSKAFSDFCVRHSIQIAFKHDGKEARFAFGSPMEPVQAQIARGKYFDVAELDFVRALLPMQPTIIDIAPNVGNHVVYYGLHMAARRIIPAGVIPRDAAALRRNVALNGLGGTVDLSKLGAAIDPALGAALKGKADFIRIGESAGLPALQSLSGLVAAAKPVLFVTVPNDQVDGLLLWAGDQSYRIVHSAVRKGVQSHVLLPAGHPALPAAGEMPGLRGFVITLLDMPQSVKVANRTLESTQRFGIPAEIFPATTRHNSQAELARLGIPVRQYDQSNSSTDAVLGLFVSSYRIWQKIAEELDYGIVIEHDAVFTAPIPDLRGKGDIVNLGKPSWGSYNVKNLPGIYGMFSKNPHPVHGITMPGTHAYFLTREGAKQLMQKARELGAAPCDLFLNSLAFPDIKEAYPWIAVAVDTFSTIQKQNGCLSKHGFNEEYQLLADSAEEAGKPAANPKEMVVVSFFTKTWEYEQKAQALMSACSALQLPFDVQERRDTGKWRTNTALKPAYIREMLDRHEHILWLDCDGTLLESPTECRNHPEAVDIMACPHRTVAGRDWHVGILSIRSNARTKAFVDGWIAQVAKHVEHETTDEFAFIKVLQSHPDVRFEALPDEYHVVMQSGMAPAGTVYGLGISRDTDKLQTYRTRDRLAYL